MITTAADTGHLTVYVTDGPVDDAALTSVMDLITGEPVIVDASLTQSCLDLYGTIARQTPGKGIVISNLLEAFYDSRIPTREAARVLGKVKSLLESLARDGAEIVVVCRRHAEDLGTRSHFMASLCASADQVYFRRST